MSGKVSNIGIAAAALVAAVALLLSNVLGIRTSLDRLLGYVDPELKITLAGVAPEYWERTGAEVVPTSESNPVAEKWNHISIVVHKKYDVSIARCWVADDLPFPPSKRDKESSPSFDVLRGVAQTTVFLRVQVGGREGKEINIFVGCDGAVSNTITARLR